MPDTNLNIKIDSELKDKAQSVFDAMGIDMSAAVSMLLNKVLLHNIHLHEMGHMSTQANEKKDRRAAFGCLKGKIIVPDDFNEPLDDFREYMQ